MSLFAKIMVVVNFILAVAFLGAAGTLLGATESWKAQYNRVTNNLNEEIATLDAQVKARQDDLARINEQIAAARSRADTSEAQLKQLQDNNRDLNARNQELQQIVERMTTSQADLQATNKELEARVDTMRNEVSTAQAEKRAALEDSNTLRESLARESQAREQADKDLAAQQQANAGLQESLDSTTTSLELMKRTFGPVPSTIAMKSVNGVVQAADNRHDVYVLSVGANEGVQVGYEFTVYRGNEYIGTIVVDKVEARYATGRTKRGFKKREIQPGDAIATHL